MIITIFIEKRTFFLSWVLCQNHICTFSKRITWIIRVIKRASGIVPDRSDTGSMFVFCLIQSRIHVQPPPLSDHQSKTLTLFKQKRYSWKLSKTTSSCKRPRSLFRCWEVNDFHCFEPIVNDQLTICLIILSCCLTFAVCTRYLCEELK